MKSSSKLSRDETNALSGWVNGFSHKNPNPEGMSATVTPRGINSHLAGEKPAFSDPHYAKHVAQDAAHLNAAIAKQSTHQDRVVYRGTRLHRQIKPGQVLSSPRITSHTEDKEIARGYAEHGDKRHRGYLFEVHAPAGSKMLDVEAHKDKRLPVELGREREHTFGSNQQLRIHSVEHRDGITHVVAHALLDHERVKRPVVRKSVPAVVLGTTRRGLQVYGPTHDSYKNIERVRLLGAGSAELGSLARQAHPNYRSVDHEEASVMHHQAQNFHAARAHQAASESISKAQPHLAALIKAKLPLLESFDSETIGQTRSGKPIYRNAAGKSRKYKGFGNEDHRDAREAHIAEANNHSLAASKKHREGLPGYDEHKAHEKQHWSRADSHKRAADQIVWPDAFKQIRKAKKMSKAHSTISGSMELTDNALNRTKYAAHVKAGGQILMEAHRDAFKAHKLAHAAHVRDGDTDFAEGHLNSAKFHASQMRRLSNDKKISKAHSTSSGSMELTDNALNRTKYAAHVKAGGQILMDAHRDALKAHKLAHAAHVRDGDKDFAQGHLNSAKFHASQMRRLSNDKKNIKKSFSNIGTTASGLDIAPAFSSPLQWVYAGMDPKTGIDDAATAIQAVTPGWSKQDHAEHGAAYHDLALTLAKVSPPDSRASVCAAAAFMHLAACGINPAQEQIIQKSFLVPDAKQSPANHGQLTANARNSPRGSQNTPMTAGLATLPSGRYSDESRQKSSSAHADANPPKGTTSGKGVLGVTRSGKSVMDHAHPHHDQKVHGSSWYDQSPGTSASIGRGSYHHHAELGVRATHQNFTAQDHFDAAELHSRRGKIIKKKLEGRPFLVTHTPAFAGFLPMSHKRFNSEKDKAADEASIRHQNLANAHRHEGRSINKGGYNDGHKVSSDLSPRFGHVASGTGQKVLKPLQKSFLVPDAKQSPANHGQLTANANPGMDADGHMKQAALNLKSGSTKRALHHMQAAAYISSKERKMDKSENLTKATRYQGMNGGDIDNLHRAYASAEERSRIADKSNSYADHVIAAGSHMYAAKLHKEYAPEARDRILHHIKNARYHTNASGGRNTDRGYMETKRDLDRLRSEPGGHDVVKKALALTLTKAFAASGSTR